MTQNTHDETLRLVGQLAALDAADYESGAYAAIPAWHPRNEDPPPPADPPKDPAPYVPPPRTDPPASKAFSQEELDRIVQDRVARAQAAKAKEFEGFDDLKAKASKLDEIEAAQKSDLEKAASRAEKAERERDEQSKRAESASRRVAGVLRRSAIVAEAAKQGAIDADAVVALIPPDQVVVADDETVTGAAKAVKELLAEKTYLLSTEKRPQDPGPSDGGARNAPSANPEDIAPGLARMASGMTPVYKK